MKFCCTLPNCKRSFPTQRGLFQHEIKDPLHNPKINYSDSRLNRNNKRGPCDSSTLPYEQGYSESNLNKKTLNGPKIHRRPKKSLNMYNRDLLKSVIQSLICNH